MVVDDTIANLKLLEGILGRRGYRVRSFPRGRLALSAAVVEPPDVILLDINIPEMNGYEVCARLKADPALAPIPVIFISALNETWDKARAFGCGGVDYISKPFQIEEILARVETHVNLRRLQAQLQQQNSRQDESVRLQTRQLAGANERLLNLNRVKDTFLMLLAQGLRTPQPGLFDATARLLAATPANSTNAELIDGVQQAQAQLSRNLEDGLLLAHFQADADRFAAGACPLSLVLSQAMDQAASEARRQQVFLPPVPADLPAVSGDPKLIQRAFLALLETVMTFSHPGQSVGLSCHAQADEVLVVLTAHGQTIPDSLLPEFFQTPVPGEPALNRALARQIITLFGGGITVENQELAGVKLTARLKGIPTLESAQKSQI